MALIHPVAPLAGLLQPKRPYLDPRYPEKRYTEQTAFSDDRARKRGLPDNWTLERVLDNFQINAAMHSRYLQFTVQEDAGLVQVVVKESNGEEKVIRKIPSYEIVRLIEKRNEMLGFLFDTVA
ncbi:MAG: flagellar protein FlaG [Synergistaceae bacterium]|nr:flagellar protein FlaG [Synergistaceae bacterium]